MKRYFFLLIAVVLASFSAKSQTLLSESFESSMMPPAGWTTFTTSESENWYGWILTSHAHTGNQSAFVDYSTYHSSYLITPQLAISGNMLLSFWVAVDYIDYTEYNTFTVEVSTTDTDTTSFSVIHTVVYPYSQNFTQVLVDLSAYSGQNIYLAFHVVDEFGTGAYLDDVEVFGTSSCMAPYSLATSNIGYHDATIHWSEIPDAGSYTVQYISFGDDWSNADSVSVTDTITTLTGLQSSGIYQVRVKSVCGGNSESSWTEAILFSTGCEPITLDVDSVWTEDFEWIPGTGPQVLSTCWYAAQSSSYNAPYLYLNWAASSHSGVNSMELRANSGEENILVLPAFTNTLNNLRLSFFANTTAGSVGTAGTLQVGYIMDINDPSTFTPVEAIVPKSECLNRNNSVPYGPIYFTDVDSTGIYGRMAIRFASNSYSTSWNFDDFAVSVIPECAEPIHLQASNVTATTANLSWTYLNGYIYDVLIWPSGTHDTIYKHGVSMDNGPLFVDSLTPATTYSWIARTVCPDSTYSEAFTRGHFTTPLVTIQLPYLCNFEDPNADYGEFTFSGIGANQWYIGNAVNAPSDSTPNGSRALYISDNLGVSNHYGGTSYSYAYATFDVNFPNDAIEYHLEFDYKGMGECGWDDFSVFLLDGNASVPNTGVPTGTALITNECNVSSWYHFNLVLPDVVGQSKKIVFYWHNDSYIFGNPPAAVDNIAINGNACARPSHLTVSNITNNSATLTWQENANANSWHVYYRIYETGYTMQQIPVSDSNHYVLQNLDASTDYVCFVTADCEEGQSSFSNIVEFRTTCSPDGITTLPYEEDFSIYEHVDGSDYVPCWTRLGSSSDHYAYVNRGDFENNCLDFHYTPNCYTMAVLPVFSESIPLNSLMLTMDVRRHNLSVGTLEVGAMTDPTDPSTFEVIDTIELASTYTWVTQTVYCNEYSGTGRYLAFKVNNAGLYTVAIDNLVVEHLPGCMPPTHVNTSQITQNSAVIAWNGTASSYEVSLVSSDTITYVTTGNSILFNNLTPSTTYSVTVRSICDGDTSSPSHKVHFHTLCGAITVTETHPWFESFENYTGTNTIVALSPCWPIVVPANIGNTTYPTVRNEATACHSGEYSLELKGNSNLFVLPEFTNDLNTLRVTLWGNTSAYYPESAGTLELGYVTDLSDSSFIPVFNIPPTAMDQTGTDAPYTNLIGPYDLSSVTPQAGMRIAFRYSHYSLNDSWNLDDFTVSLIPDCPSPEKHSITVTEITNTSAKINWVDDIASHNAWRVHHKPANAVNWQVDTVYNTPSLTITGLNDNTTYDVYVTTLCANSGVNPDATLTKQFTTKQTAAALPYTTDFSQPQEWRLNNGECANYWVIRNLTPTGNNHAMFITNNGVITGYDVTASSHVTAEKIFTVGTHSQYKIEFDVNVGGEKTEGWDYDYMKLFFAPATQEYESATTENPYWSSQTYSDYAFDFTDYISMTSSTMGTPYNFSLTNGNTIHISAIMDNPYPNPTASSEAKVVFAWVNDHLAGMQPGAVITNLSVSAVACPQPKNLTITNISDNEADLYWLPGENESEWDLEYRSANSNEWYTVTPTANSYHLTGLTPSTEYQVRLRANCIDETSPYVNASFTTTHCNQHGQCFYTLHMADSYGDGWNESSLSILQNNIIVQDITLSDSYSADAVISLCDSTPTVLIWNPGWEEGAYDYECSFSLESPDGTTLFSINDLSTITSSTLFSFITDCSSTPTCAEPTGLTANNITTTSADISWPAGNGYYWVLQYRDSAATAWSPEYFLDSPAYNITGLIHNTTYQVRVKANCSDGGWSEWSDVLNFTTLYDSSYVIEPTVVTNTATSITAYGATLNGAIVDPGSHPTTGRGFEWKAAADTAYNVVYSTSTSAVFSAHLTNLTSNTNYQFRAFATTETTITYGEVMTFTTDIVACEIPTDLDTVAVESQTITITWTDNADANRWNIRHRAQNGAWSSHLSTTTSYVITDLTPNTNYEIQVQADCEGDGLSDWSETLSVLTHPVGIDDHLMHSIALYPNPAKHYVDIRVSDDNINVMSLEVFDVYGKLIRTVEMTENPTRIPVGELANGMYFVRITTDNGTATKSFVKH